MHLAGQRRGRVALAQRRVAPRIAQLHLAAGAGQAAQDGLLHRQPAVAAGKGAGLRRGGKRKGERPRAAAAAERRRERDIDQVRVSAIDTRLQRLAAAP